MHLPWHAPKFVHLIYLGILQRDVHVFALFSLHRADFLKYSDHGSLSTGPVPLGAIALGPGISNNMNNFNSSCFGSEGLVKCLSKLTRKYSILFIGMLSN